MHRYLRRTRLRSGPATPSAHGLSEPELEDHLATFLLGPGGHVQLADLAAGGDGEALRDGTSIQRTVSERHGSQRRRLGWGEDEIRREFQILQEEVAAAILRRVHRPRAGEVDEALDAIARFIAASERISLDSYRRGE